VIPAIALKVADLLEATEEELLASTADLGIRSIWINRLGERAEPAPTRELPDLAGLADMLDELVPRS
jgi:FMN phosphatase YigB (HAD superfamily)